MPKHDNQKLAVIILLVFVAFVFLITFIFIPRISQWESYHHFSDQRTVYSIPNFCNVISNVLFCFVSILGFHALYRQRKRNCLLPRETIVFAVLFLGIFLTGLGSCYYHWAPNNHTLVWDRIPITLVFMSLLALTIMEKVNSTIGFWLLVPLIIFGIFSVEYWHWTEDLGHGDLRLYALVQFCSMFVIAAILYLFPTPYPPLKSYLWMMFFYALAKLCEHLDALIYMTTGWISGHTLKHIFAAISTYWIVVMLKQKEPI